MLRLRSFLLLLALMIFSADVPFLLPVVQGQGIACQIQINEIQYPLLVQPGQNFDVVTTLTVTCSPALATVNGRVDLFEQSTGKQLSLEGFPLSSNLAPQWTVSATVSSSLKAPSLMEVWPLRMVVWIAVGLGAPALRAGQTEQNLGVQVGEATSNALTTSMIVGQGLTRGYVLISSNSTISGERFDSSLGLIHFNADGPTGERAFTSVLLPTYLIHGYPTLLIDNGNIAPFVLGWSSNSSHYLLWFGYGLSTHVVTVGGSGTIPEFDYHMLPLVMSLLGSLVVLSLFRRDIRQPMNPRRGK